MIDSLLTNYAFFLSHCKYREANETKENIINLFKEQDKEIQELSDRYSSVQRDIDLEEFDEFNN